MNKIVQFRGVTQSTFNSIYRRGWVCVMKARFVDPDIFKEIENPEEKGIFLKKPELKDYLKCTHACGGMWRIIQGHMEKYTKEQHRQACSFSFVCK